MDKYTVDLDQVLNDFEYSELTDQYNTSRSTSSTSTVTQNIITKHSINNVFHSLNEYLNTNINVNQIDNNPLLEDKENYISDVNRDTVTQSFKEEPSIKENNFKTDTLLLDFNGKTDEDNESESEVRVKVEITKTDVADSTSFDLIGEEVPIEEAHTVVENAVNSDKEEVKKEENKNKTEVYINEVVTEPVLLLPSVDTEIKVDEPVLQQENTNVENVAEVVAESTENISVNICDSDTKPEEQIGDLENEAVEKIGFDDDVELDEIEVMRLLEELEDEQLDASEKRESHSDLIENIGEIVKEQNSLVEVEPVEEITSPSVSTQKTDEAQLLVKEDIVDDYIKETTSPIEETSKENVIEEESIKETITYTDEASKSSVLSSEEVSTTENTDVVVSEASVAEHVDQVQTEIETVVESTVEEDGKNENVPQPLEEIVETKTPPKQNEECEVEEELSAESASRPQNLPLTGEGDQPKRKINLIGDPGSTPYNNVYINKEIPKSKDKAKHDSDSDTDYSTSSSPTFSDASSTTSTVSLEDARETPATQDGSQSREDPNQASAIPNQESQIKAHNSEEVAENPAPDSANPTSDAVSTTSTPNNAVSEEQVALEVPSQELVENYGAGAVSMDDTNAQSNLGAGSPRVENLGEVNVGAINMEKQWLGKEAPLWVPDSDAMSCLHCDMKFTVLKRRHHCRACGLVLCSKCCHLRFRLEYLEAEARVCNKCHDILNKDTNSTSSSDMSPEVGNSPAHRPNPNNPLEYCSTVSPLQQEAGANPNPPAVMVPVGVLKRKGSNKGKSNKSVMFCDGIRPGSDLTNLDNDFDYNNTKTKKSEKIGAVSNKPKKNLPVVDPDSNTFIPSNENCLPPTVSICKAEISYVECLNGPAIVEVLKNEQLTFAINVNLYIHVKIINMSCCINKTAWCFSTEGLINVGQDEIVILLEYIDEESFVPKDLFYHISSVYNDAVKGTSVKEMELSLHNASNFLDSKNHAGFVYIRPTFQCLENIIRPKEPYLVGILIHRWETPWAKLFPLRLILRLGAEYRYYPSPIISTRHRESVFVEIGHTIINLLADFRNFSYTLPQIRGLTIHMEDKNTTITIPTNRYDQVMKSMSNSSEHIVVFGGNFSQQADSHLVCIQDTQGNENCYSTHAINIHNQPRKITGASFIVFNGSLKSSSGLTAKSNIVEDGLMIQVLPEHVQQIRDNLKGMKNHTIPCGCINAVSDETVNIVWGENDTGFNIGVVSAIDNTPLSGIPSIRVHNGKNHICANGSRIIRWSEVFIIQSGEDNPKHHDSIDISRVSESIAKATCDALVKYLDLLVANNCQKIGIRTNLHVDDVSYSAGSNGAKLPPIYMKSLDDELIPVLHRITSNNLGEHSIVLELIFRILNS